jgi:hypothetical protein
MPHAFSGSYARFHRGERSFCSLSANTPLQWNSSTYAQNQQAGNYLDVTVDSVLNGVDPSNINDVLRVERAEGGTPTLSGDFSCYSGL